MADVARPEKAARGVLHRVDRIRRVLDGGSIRKAKCRAGDGVEGVRDQ